MIEKNLEKKEVKVFTLEGTGKKIAFTNVNRELNNSIVNAKAKSIEQYGLLMPIIVLNAEEVASKGIDLYDADTKEKIENAENYYVILDGQHRYAAIRYLNKKKNRYFDIWLMYPLNIDEAISTLIMEINTSAVNWKNDNYISVLAELRPDNKGLAFINKYMKLRHKRNKKNEPSDNLPNNGYGLSVLSKYLTLDASINKKYLYKMASISNKELPNDVNVERAKNIITTGLEVGFTHHFLASRFFIDWIAKWVRSEHKVDEILNWIKDSMTPEKAEKLMEECNANNFKDKFDEVIKVKKNQYYANT